MIRSRACISTALFIMHVLWCVASLPSQPSFANHPWRERRGMGMDMGTAPTTTAPTIPPTVSPIHHTPSNAPSVAPSISPTASPVEAPTASPVEAPTASPVEAPTASPVEVPTASPVEAPTTSPIFEPTAAPVAHSTTTPTSMPTATPPLPTVLLVLVDDLGSFDLGYKNGVVESPTIDALVADGVRLTSYYAFVQCAPSRVSLLTGRYAWRQGSYHNGSPQYNAPNIAFTLLPQVLKNVAGYRKCFQRCA